MRCLFLSNFYPPEALGGYEMWCQEIGGELARRGHQVHVLTSGTPGKEAAAGVVVHRNLPLEVIGALPSTIARALRRHRLSAAGRRAVDDAIASSRPDVALVWGMWNVPRAVPAHLEAVLPQRVAYFLSDYWPRLPNAFVEQLASPPRRAWLGLAKRAAAAALLPGLRRASDPPLEFAHPLCVSRALREELVAAGVAVADAPVIHGGTDFAALDLPPPAARDGGPFRVVSVSRLTAEKGLHTAIDAMALLHRARPGEFTLDLYGKGDYAALLDRRIADLALEACVRRLGPVSRQQLPRLLTDYDAFVFPSQWAEPFGRAGLEAMAMGVPLVGSGTGGTSEFLEDGVTGLLFANGNAAALAAALERLRESPELSQRLAIAARRAVCERFSLTHMADNIEHALQDIVAAAPPLATN